MTTSVPLWQVQRFSTLCHSSCTKMVEVPEKNTGWNVFFSSRLHKDVHALYSSGTFLKRCWQRVMWTPALVHITNWKTNYSSSKPYNIEVRLSLQRLRKKRKGTQTHLGIITNMWTPKIGHCQVTSAPGQVPQESRRAHRWVKTCPHRWQHKQARGQQVPDPGPVNTTHTCTSHTSAHVLPPSTPLGCGAAGTPRGQQPPSHHRPQTSRRTHLPGPSRPGQQPGNRGVGRPFPSSPLGWEVEQYIQICDSNI